MKKFTLLFIFLFTTKLIAAPLEVAITFDDLPMHMTLPNGKTRVDVAQKILNALDKHSIKNVYGFVNANQINNANGYKVLSMWVSQGQLLGNHTYDHINLDSHDATKFIQQIQKNDIYLSNLMKNKNYHYFRYPYLHEGNTQIKRDAVRHYLFTHQYQIAQVTVDFSDYLWNKPYARCLKKGDKRSIAWLKKSYIEQAVNALKAAQQLSELIVHRNIKNILLLHFGAFDAVMLDDLLTAYEKNGVKFITLSDALKDKIYKINPNIVSEDTDIFTTQLLHAEKLPVSHELNLLLTGVPETQLKKLCRTRSRMHLMKEN